MTPQRHKPRPGAKGSRDYPEILALKAALKKAKRLGEFTQAGKIEDRLRTARHDRLRQEVARAFEQKAKSLKRRVSKGRGRRRARR